MAWLLTLMINSAFASDFHISCSSSVNSAQVYSEGDKVYFRFDDSLGFRDFPIFNGTLTPASVPLVNRGVKELKVFDGAMMVMWPRQSCRYDVSKPLLVMCDGRGEILIPEKTTFTASGVNTAVETQERSDMSFSRLNFNVGLDTPASDYMHYFLGFPFNKDRCTAR